MLSVAPQSQQGNLHTQFATTKKTRIYTTANNTSAADPLITDRRTLAAEIHLLRTIARSHQGTVIIHQPLQAAQATTQAMRQLGYRTTLGFGGLERTVGTLEHTLPRHATTRRHQDSHHRNQSTQGVPSSRLKQEEI
jgi:hypothetical protein